MITAPQMRAARALLGIDQRTLAQRAGVSVPTIQRMEASTGQVRGTVDSLGKVVAALEAAGVELHSAKSVTFDWLEDVETADALLPRALAGFDADPLRL